MNRRVKKYKMKKICRHDTYIINAGKKITLRILYPTHLPTFFRNPFLVHTTHSHICSPRFSHPLFLRPTLFPVSLYTYFVHLLECFVIVSPPLPLQRVQTILSHFILIIDTPKLRFMNVYSCLMPSNLVTKHMYLNGLASSGTFVFISLFRINVQHSDS